MSTKMFYSLLTVVAITAITGLYGLGNGWFNANPRRAEIASNNRPEQQPEIDEKEAKEKGMVKIGGVWRDKRDVQLQEKPKLSENNGKSIGERIGFPPGVAPDANEYVRSVTEARKFPKKFPERLSMAILPKPFDQREFDKDPQKYLKVIEPGRIMQNLPDGPGVPSLKATSPLFHQVIQGESVSLQVKAVEGAPVSFHAVGAGQFSSLLNTITVKADKSGVARAHFKTTKGSHGLIKIFAASPVTSRRAQFFVTVALPSNP